MVRITFPWGALVATAILSSTASAFPAEKAATVHWRRAIFEAGDWPRDLPEEARIAVEAWSGWAHDAGYRLDLDEDARVLMLSHAKFNRSVRRESELVERTLEAFDALAGAPPLPRPTGSEPEVWRPYAGPVVLVRLRDAGDFAHVLDHLAVTHPYLSGWTESVKEAPGALLWEPLCAMYVERVKGIDEWRVDNELVHRLGTTLLRSQYGHVPHWLEKGVAWNVEMTVCRSIWAFPHREGFVGVGEHKGWEKALKKSLGDREGLVLSAEDLDAWERGTYDDHAAGLAWGMVGFLAEYRPGTLGPILRDLGSFHEAGSVLTHDDGSWERIADFETPPSVQHRVFERHAGDDVYAECTRYLQLGRRYRPGRR